MNKNQEEILDCIKNYPKLSVAELSTLLGKTQPAIKGVIYWLEEKGLVIREMKPAIHNIGKQGGRPYIVCFSANESAEPIKEEPVKVKRVYNKKDVNLLEEVKQLRLWKERAIMRFPELDVDPIILLAREALAKHYTEKKQREDILSGRVDSRPPMQAMIEVMSK